MTWTIVALIILILLGVAGYIIRSRQIKKYIDQDFWGWKQHARETFMIENSTFHCKMRTRIGFMAGLLAILGLGFFLPEWFGWLDPAYYSLLNVAGLALLILGFAKMRIWPWSGAFLQVCTFLSSVEVQRADGRIILDTHNRAVFSVSWSGISGDYELPLTRAWATIERKKFSIPGADIGKQNLTIARFYMAKSGFPGYNYDLPEELQRLL